MENKDCILIKKNEYERLKRKNVDIRIYNDYCGRYSTINKSIVVLSNSIIDLVSTDLLRQINRIKFLISESLENKFKGDLLVINSKMEESFDLGYDNACREIANMSYWERRKFLKQWKQK